MSFPAAIESWGRLSKDLHQVDNLTDLTQAKRIITSQKNLPAIAYGMGRSYGDVCLNPTGILWQTKYLNHFIAFDPNTGILRCEAGVSLEQIQKTFVPQGWMLAVSPGTQMVTVGGAIANDIHGKNHHRQGSFGEHVLALTLQRTSGETIFCDRHHQPDWLNATIGGLGLTGILLEATIQLRRIDNPWLVQQCLPFEDLSSFFKLSQESEKEWEYTVAWIDCFNGKKTRGIFMRAYHSLPLDQMTWLSFPRQRQHSTKKSFPFAPHSPPFSLVNPLSLKAFNHLYFYAKSRQAGMSELVHYQPFLYPLDHIQHWNLMYGRKGFFQYQSVIPTPYAQEATAEMLATIKQAKQGSFLAVLKNLSHRPSGGLLSFPMQGTTLALDFANRGEKTEKLLSQLDTIVKNAQGRLYPAKDARMPASLFEAGYPNLSTWKNYRDTGLSSAMSRRLMGH
jgi:FAD/FMN-containing dehydrogenase